MYNPLDSSNMMKFMKNILLSLVLLLSSSMAFASEEMLILENPEELLTVENQTDFQDLFLLADRHPSPFEWENTEHESNGQFYSHNEPGPKGNKKSGSDKVYEFKDKYLPIYAFIFHRKNAEINPSSDSFYERCLYPKKYSKEQILAYTKKIDKKFTITTLNNWFVNFRSRCTKDSDSEKFQDWFSQLEQEYSNSQLNEYTYKNMPGTKFQKLKKWVTVNGIPSSLNEKIKIAEKHGLTNKQGLNFYRNLKKRS